MEPNINKPTNEKKNLLDIKMWHDTKFMVLGNGLICLSKIISSNSKQKRRIMQLQIVFSSRNILVKNSIFLVMENR